MAKKSHFLSVPVEPFVLAPDLTAEEILTRMERISFQGRNLATAHRIWQKMLADEVVIFLGTAGALSAGGLRMIIAHLIANRYVDCLVSTGANLYHDLHETRGRRHFLGSPRADDAALQAEHIDRVYDTFVSEDEFIENDLWIADFVKTLECRPYTTREFLYLLGGHLWHHTKREGILTAAYRAKVPIFCPAIADSSIGMGLSQARHLKSGAGQVDVIGDIVESANLVIRRRRTASVCRRWRHAEELHQPGQRAGGVLQRRHRGTPLRPPDRDRRAAFRRRIGLDARRSPEPGVRWPAMRTRSLSTPTPRSRFRCWPARSRPAHASVWPFAGRRRSTSPGRPWP